jgi:hypothetical protein
MSRGETLKSAAACAFAGYQLPVCHRRGLDKPNEKAKVMKTLPNGNSPAISIMCDQTSPANEEPITTTRRSFVMNSIVALPIAAAVPTIAPAMPLEPSEKVTLTPGVDDLDTLWQEREAIVQEDNALYPVLLSTQKSMPQWAQSGPTYLNGAGVRCGPEVGWPEVAELPALPPTENTYRNIRPSPSDLKREFDLLVEQTGKADIDANSAIG